MQKKEFYTIFSGNNKLYQKKVSHKISTVIITSLHILYRIKIAQWIIEEEQIDPLQAKANFARICQLLVDKGGDALRQALHVVHPPSTLAAALNSHRRTLQRLRYKVIISSQWKLLYPAARPPDSKTFDVTLLAILFRNIYGLSSPVTGWNTMPLASDTAISADILRIKMFRNDVYGHIPSAQYDHMTF